MIKTVSTLLIMLLGAVACSHEPDSSRNRADEFAQWKGRWMVVNYWAVWCKPCIEEIPELNALQSAYPQQLKLFGVNYDGASGETLQDQIKQLNIKFEVLPRDPATALGTSRPQVLPTTLLFAPDGSLAHTLIGPQTEESLKKLMHLSSEEHSAQ